MKKKAGLYIHFPFCKRKCFYCHFLTLPHGADQAGYYVDVLVRELGMRSRPGVTVDTVYLGGGSPSLMSKRELFSVMEAVHRHFSLSVDPEVSIECNPEDCSPDQFKTLKEAGFNRLSIGVQSFQEKELRFLKRNHTSHRCLNSISQAREAGFSNISIDLMIGLPGQNEKTIQANLDVVSRLGIPHVSCYILEGCGREFVSEKKQQETYFHSANRLDSLGFVHYEVSSFSRPGFQCRHNLKYWKNMEYMGVGLGASGYEQEIDYQNLGEMSQYRETVKNGRLPRGESRFLNPRERRIVTGLRLLEGVPRSSFGSHEEELGFLMGENLLEARGNRVAVNPDRILLLNEILTYFV
jgi:oxygen-independent coproporphyrinogen-3 oxidase